MKLRLLAVAGIAFSSLSAYADAPLANKSRVVIQDAYLRKSATNDKGYTFSITSDDHKNSTILFGVRNLTDKESKTLVKMSSNPVLLGDIIEKRGAVGVYSSITNDHPTYGTTSRSLSDIPQAVDHKTGNEYKFNSKGVSVTTNAHGKLCIYAIPTTSHNDAEVVYSVLSKKPSCLKNDKIYPYKIVVSRKKQKT